MPIVLVKYEIIINRIAKAKVELVFFRIYKLKINIARKEKKVNGISDNILVDCLIRCALAAVNRVIKSERLLDIPLCLRSKKVRMMQDTVKTLINILTIKYDSPKSENIMDNRAGKTKGTTVRGRPSTLYLPVSCRLFPPIK